MSFEESVIVPLDIYQKQSYNQPKTEAERILQKVHLPSDLKVKLFDQARWQKKQKKHPVKETLFPLDQLQIKDQPFVKSILEQYINKNRNVVSWIPDTLELVIEGQRQTNSNIVRAFQNIMQGKVDEISRVLKEKLLEIGVPQDWMPAAYIHPKTDTSLGENRSPPRVSQDWTSAAYSQHTSGTSLRKNRTPIATRTRIKSTPIAWKTRARTKKTSWSPYF